MIPFSQEYCSKNGLKNTNMIFFIVNIKEEGIEQKVQDLLSARGVERYFFLDVSVPFMVKLTSKGITNFAVRFSEYESLSLAKRFSKLLNWIWIDSFYKFNHSFDDLLYIKELNLIPCFVSPELQGRFDLSEVQYIKNLAAKAFGDDYYVCTKHPEFWQS